MPTADGAQKRIGAMPVEALVAKLGSDAITPGAGAAGAVALALAAACASKAIAITAKHRTLPPALVDAAGSIARLQEAALHGADQDVEHFRTYLKHRSAETEQELRQSNESLCDLCEALKSIIDRISADVHEVVAGDISAARVLSEAAIAIHLRNEATT